MPLQVFCVTQICSLRMNIILESVEGPKSSKRFENKNVIATLLTLFVLTLSIILASNNVFVDVVCTADA